MAPSPGRGGIFQPAEIQYFSLCLPLDPGDMVGIMIIIPCAVTSSLGPFFFVNNFMVPELLCSFFHREHLPFLSLYL